MLSMRQHQGVGCLDWAFQILAGTVSVENKNHTHPLTFKISQNYPNPFNSSTAINYQLPEEVEIRITIYNLIGQKIKILMDEKKEKGYYTTHWNGRNDKHNEVVSGIYIARIEAISKQKKYIGDLKLLYIK
jgi:flagellar hook assembly protein FlgD